MFCFIFLLCYWRDMCWSRFHCHTQAQMLHLTPPPPFWPFKWMTQQWFLIWCGNADKNCTCLLPLMGWYFKGRCKELYWRTWTHIDVSVGNSRKHFCAMCYICASTDHFEWEKCSLQLYSANSGKKKTYKMCNYKRITLLDCLIVIFFSL